MEKIIVLENINKKYKTKENIVDVFKNLNINFETGKLYAIMGKSGSGKSTLINILGLMDEFDSGTYKLFNADVSNLKDTQLSYLRMKNIGFVFQDFQLNEYMTAMENIMLPMLINKEIKKNDRETLANKFLKLVKLENRANHFPKELSGGEQQRVAIARALVNNPKIILADEPTGNLDQKSETEIFSILKKLTNNNKCVIVVTHSTTVKKYADVIYKLENGKLIGDTYENK